jgi:hypothetical protein
MGVSQRFKTFKPFNRYAQFNRTALFVVNFPNPISMKRFERLERLERFEQSYPFGGMW